LAAGAFWFGDAVVSCPWPLPLVACSSPVPAEIEVTRPGPGASASSPTFPWAHRWTTADGDVTLCVASLPDGFLLRFPGQADFVVSDDGGLVRPQPHVGTGVAALTHLLIDQVLPRVLALRGALVLHAAAVSTRMGTAVFIGETGRGKSTLAASLALDGCTLLSDDGLVVTAGDDRVQAIPTYPSLRLWPDSLETLFPDRPPVTQMAEYSDKCRLRVDDGQPSAPQAVVVDALFLLGEAEGSSGAVRVEPVTPRDVVLPLLSNSFQLDVTTRTATARLLHAASVVADRVPAFRLSFPHRYEVLPDVRDVLYEHLVAVRPVSGAPR
jgi:hypothetical protein